MTLFMLRRVRNVGAITIITITIICREFESEAPAAEEMLDRVICSREQFSFQMCLESGDGSGTFCIWRHREFQRAGAMILNALD